MRGKSYAAHGLSGDRTGQRFDARLGIALDVDTLAVMKNLALQLGVSVPALARAAIRDFLARHATRRRATTSLDDEAKARAEARAVEIIDAAEARAVEIIDEAKGRASEIKREGHNSARRIVAGARKLATIIQRVERDLTLEQRRALGQFRASLRKADLPPLPM